MPELPEVETTKRGISPFLVGQSIKQMIVRQTQLRLPVPPGLNELCQSQLIHSVSRRAKYLILQLSKGYLLIHLGMSGHLRIMQGERPADKHDHIDLCLSNGLILRYNDPRRFGLWLYLEENPCQHRLLSHLGPEPLSDPFNGEYLSQRAQKKTQKIKTFIMNNEVVVGVGNIYATESLFLAGIHPQKAAGSLALQDFEKLARAIKKVLQQAIEAGGTTLRDFYAFDGKPGYFAHALQVYGRQKHPCFHCNSTIQTLTLGGRNSAFCPNCQPLTFINDS